MQPLNRTPHTLQVSDETVERLLVLTGGLTELSLAGCSGITDRTLRAAAAVRGREYGTYKTVKARYKTVKAYTSSHIRQSLTYSTVKAKTSSQIRQSLTYKTVKAYTSFRSRGVLASLTAPCAPPPR